MSSQQAAEHYALPELTLRGCLLSAVITVFLTAANVYLGLKVGLTFATSIPAAVISMALLSRFKNSNILENNMVQSFASAAGTLASVIFVLPGLLMLHVWTEIHYWQVMLICCLGGILGVLYSVPLRRAMVVESSLPYPEGVAAAEILLVGSATRELDEKAIDNIGFKALIGGSVISAAYALCTTGLKLFSSTLSSFLALGSGIYGLSISLSPALLGAGYLAGIGAAISMLIGVFLGWGILVPYLTHLHAAVHIGDLASMAETVWATKVRIIGSGAIAIAAVWTLMTLGKPVINGIHNAIKSLKSHHHRGTAPKRTEHDIPMHWVLGSIICLTLPLFGLFVFFMSDLQLPIETHKIYLLSTALVLFTLCVGILVAAACGYMAGLVGSSNSPASGIAVISVIASSLLLLILLKHAIPDKQLLQTGQIALAIFITSIVMAIACIANDNLQDLKTGQLVGATPWRQQVALIYGVIIGSFIVPFIVSSLYHTYGFVGAMPRAGMNLKEALFAPQANLMADLARGIILHQLDWTLFFTGAGIAVVIILIDELILKPRQLRRVSALAVAIGIYLPVEVNMTIILGGLLSHLVRQGIKRAKGLTALDEQHLRKGILLASGLIVGESLTGVGLSIMIGITENQNFMAVTSPYLQHLQTPLGFASFAALLIGSYRYLTK